MAKHIIFTDHAVERMSERKIAVDMVRQAIDSPDVSVPGANPGTTRIHKRLKDGRTLQVILKAKKNTVLVITVCWR